MNPEIMEYLAIVEMKLQSLLQDIKNIRCRLEEPQTPKYATGKPSFFDALKAEDGAQGAKP